MKQVLADVVSSILGQYPSVIEVSSVSGGSINQCFRVKTEAEDLFIKANNARSFPEMFEKEKNGLELIQTSCSFDVPRVYGVVERDDTAFLVMAFVESGSAHRDFSADFAEKLHRMHRISSDHFGLHYNNYIGSLVQDNLVKTSWKSFFIENRITPLLHAAIDKKLLERRYAKTLTKLENAISNVFPMEAPSLLHGDLWSGNYLVSPSGRPILVDPAVYFGHRYMDLGMMQLFGGFDPSIFDNYCRLAKLDQDWKRGANLANLYPLLVHVNLFGSGYSTQVSTILNDL